MSEPFTPHWGYTRYPVAYHVIPPDGFNHVKVANTCLCGPTVNGDVVTHKVIRFRPFTEEEEDSIRRGDAYDPEDSDISDEIIARGKPILGH